MTRFTHLHARSSFSFHDGFSSPQALAKRARAMGFEALALTDRHNLYAAVKFSRACRSAGIKPVLGAEVRVAVSSAESRGTESQWLVLLARDEAGYHNLCRLLSESERAAGPHGPRATRAMLQKNRSGLVALSGGADGVLAKAAREGDEVSLRRLAQDLAELFEPGAFYLEIQPSENPGLHAAYSALEACGTRLGLPLIAARTIGCASTEDIAHHAAVLALDRTPDGEMAADGGPIASQEEMSACFPGKEALLQAAWDLGERCGVDLASPRPFVLPGPPPEEAGPILEKSAREGLEKIFLSRVSSVGKKHGESSGPFVGFYPRVEERLRYELDSVREAGFENYFLAAGRIARLAEEKGILLGPGRGSAVGSLLAFALGLTRINPLEHGLYFERFLNPARKSPPDIDIDVEHERREELLGLLSREFGEHHLAGLVTFSTLRARAAVKEAARILKIQDAEVEDFNETPAGGR